ncbi:complement decay-accelerating factor [Egretta garzetta]|uniref:complement decay-accelerating factor n=1 Tax=Egretta garzetta TaxID=188379 RepID=UPI00163C3635|nr:complement decay-accelerating factor [Egretta garzetta]
MAKVGGREAEGRAGPILVVSVGTDVSRMASGDCGPLPNINHAEPPEDVKHRERFPVGFKVTYRCLAGYSKLPLLSDTMQCLANTEWSNLQEFCGRSCSSPPRVRFARLSEEDGIQNFYAVNTVVTYVCRSGYENATDQLPTSTCLDNVTWSAVPELCRRKSCGVPANPEHGKVIANDHLFGARANVVCDHGYVLKGASTFIFCSLVGDKVAWSQLPACQAITCPPPLAIPSGKHNSNGMEKFTYSSLVTYSCDPGLQLVGNETLHCTTENGVNGIWSGPPPKCRAVVSTAATTNQTTPLEEKAEGSLLWLVGVFVPVFLVLGIPAGIMVKRKFSRKDNYNMQLQKHKMGGRGPLMHPKRTDDKKQPVPWRSYFCHTTSCHVCPTCTLRTYLVPSIDGSESQSPGGTSSPASAAEVLRADGSGGAVLEQSEAEQPMNQKSDQHVCPVCAAPTHAHLCQPRHQAHDG